ncbi:MAG: 50S ribosomal protein L22 [Candidatus Omnitrophica bacterium]|nr:50S ribosomal protein L22 [Candidatus Omnitrophota bacterium]
MIAKAEAKFIRLVPRKVRLVMNLIREKDVSEAAVILQNVETRPTGYITKILKSAVANAKTKGFTEDQLVISKIICNNGPMWKRFKAGSFGRAAPILKRTSHIKIELDLKKQI